MDKFKNYYYLIDVFNYDNNYSEPSKEIIESDLFVYFETVNPLYLDVLMNYLHMIIKKICAENKREEIKTLVEEIKNFPEKFNGKYDYKDISLSKLFKGDYQFLKNIFVINWNIILNEKSFLEKFICDEDPNLSYSFSIKEFYDAILPRAIDITINNYYK